MSGPVIKFRITGQHDDEDTLRLETNDGGDLFAVAESGGRLTIDVFDPNTFGARARVIIDATDGGLSVGIDTGREIAVMTLTPAPGGGYLLTAPDSYDSQGHEFTHAAIAVPAEQEQTR